MSEELKAAFESVAERGHRAGATAVVARALTAARSDLDNPRRRYPRFAVAVAVAVSVAAASVTIARELTPDVDRVNLGAALSDGDGLPGAMTVLIVGTDGTSRSDAPRRADAVMLVRVDKTSGAVSVLSLPRDLYVPVAGADRSDRLATAFVSGVIPFVDTVRAVTGLAVDHYIEFDFDAFTHAVDAVGGVDLLMTAAMRDRVTGLDLAAGCHHLDGETALALVRARHIETKDASGRFVADPSGDLGRVIRQQMLFVVALDEVTRTLAPGRIRKLAQAISGNVRTDDTFSLDAAVAFAEAWANKAGPLQMLVYPSTPTILPSGAAALRPDTTEVPGVINAFSHPPDGPPRTAAEVSC